MGTNQQSVNPIQTILRWLFTLPASILGAGIVHSIFILLNSTSMTESGDEISDMFGQASPWKQILASCIFGGAFVFIGYSVAPAYKNIVATILAGIILFVSGMAMTGLFNESFTIGIIASVAMNIGSIAVCVNGWKGNLS